MRLHKIKVMVAVSLLTCSATVFGEEAPPDLEFLEFLGHWETQDGSWFDPIQLLNDQEKNTENDNDAIHSNAGVDKDD